MLGHIRQVSNITIGPCESAAKDREDYDQGVLEARMQKRQRHGHAAGLRAFNVVVTRALETSPLPFESLYYW